MTLQQIKYYLEVAETQQFTQAAKNLYVSQSSLSHAIQELENELGVPLFVRNIKRKISLTEYGQKFLPYAKQVITALEEGEDALNSLKDPLSGTVKLGFYFCVANSEVPHIFRKFYDDNPDCNIFLDFDINQGNSLIEEHLQLGTYDLLITTSETLKDCSSAPVGRQKLKVLVANNHPLANKKSIALEELQGETFINLTPHSNLDNWIREMFAQANLKPNITYANNWMTQFGYVAMNYGVAITPTMPLYQNYISELELDHPMVWRNLYLHWPENRPLSKAAQFVRNYILHLVEMGEFIE